MGLRAGGVTPDGWITEDIAISGPLCDPNHGFVGL